MVSCMVRFTMFYLELSPADNSLFYGKLLTAPIFFGAFQLETVDVLDDLTFRLGSDMPSPWGVVCVNTHRLLKISILIWLTPLKQVSADQTPRVKKKHIS